MDEIPEIQNLTLTTCVNDMTLQQGDIIAIGTPAGVGFQRQPPFYLQAGDMVEVEAGDRAAASP